MQSSVRAAAARASRCVGLVSCVTALSCGGHPDSGAASAPVQGGKSDSGSGGSTISLGSGASTGSGGHTGAGGTLVVGAGGGAAADAGVLVPVDAGPQPIVSCGAASDASVDMLDGAACAPPPSHCVDQHTLAYYTGGRCVDGLCSWATQFLTCTIACYGDGCRDNITR